MSATIGMHAANTLKSSVEQTETCSEKYAFIFMHGLGDEGRSWSNLHRELVQSGLDPEINNKFKWLFPNAPIAPVSCNNGYEMPSWFDIDEIPLSVTTGDDEKGIHESATRIQAMIKKLETEDGIPPENVIVGGFSQGALVSFMTGITNEQPVKGIVMLSGWVPLRNTVKEYAKNIQVPIFMGHGNLDNVVQFPLATASMEALTGIGINVKFEGYPMQHQTCSKEMKDLANWVNTLMSKTSCTERAEG